MLKSRLNLKRDEYGFLQPPRHLYGFTQKTLRMLLQKNGFKIEKVLLTVPGDPIYQPLIGQNLIERFIFKLSKVMNLGSILVIYAQK